MERSTAPRPPSETGAPRSAIGRLLLAVFDKRRGAVAFVLSTTLFALTCSWLTIAPVHFLYEVVFATPPTPPVHAWPWYGPLVAAPLFESLLFIGVIEFLYILGWRRRSMVWLVAGLSGLLHALANGPLGTFAGVVLFG